MRTAAAAPMPHCRAAPRRTRAPSLSLSCSASTQRPPLRAPSPLSPSPRRPPQRFFRHQSPSSASDPAECRRCPPPPVSAPSELLHSSIDHRLLTLGSPSSCRTSPRSSTTTGATPLPLNAAARCHLRRLTIGTPFRCAPALSSLPGISPVPPSRSPTTPCRRLAAAGLG
jgi:hypothetical protein